MPGVRLADVARKHGTTLWQVDDWRKQRRKGNLVVPERIAARPMFAQRVVDDTAVAAPQPVTRSELEIMVGEVVIRAGRGRVRVRGRRGPIDAGDPPVAGREIMMFGQGGPVKVCVATRPVDVRKGIAGLARAVPEMFGRDPFCGAVFLFRSKRAERIKLLKRGQTGMVLLHKRLEDGKCV